MDFRITTSKKTMNFTCLPTATATTISNNLTDFKTTTSRKNIDFTCLPTTTATTISNKFQNYSVEKNYGFYLSTHYYNQS